MTEEDSDPSEINLPDMFEYEGLWYQVDSQQSLSKQDLGRLAREMVSAF